MLIIGSDYICVFKKLKGQTLKGVVAVVSFIREYIQGSAKNGAQTRTVN